MNPSLANRLRIGFAITFALLAGVTVIGVGRLFQLRQDYEDATTKSFQVEIASEHLRQAFIFEQAALRNAAADAAGARARYRAAVRTADAAADAAGQLAADEGEVQPELRRRLAAERRWRGEIANPILAGRPPPPAKQTEVG